MIVPKPDGECPSCKKNTQDLRGVDPDRTLVSVGIGEALPPICVVCGRSCMSYVQCSESVTQKQDLGFFQTLFGVNRETNVIDIRLPVCPSCRHNFDPRPHHIDTENYRLTFEVHRAFREAFEAG